MLVEVRVLRRLFALQHVESVSARGQWPYSLGLSLLRLHPRAML